ncbi:hypothetical protein FQN50_006905 [Emmonsiellopsis sp. PD_5]|nr:hypothetical protein FQN50_006905 [Emmonsiellopsis sp. PD_5]
MAGVYFGEQRNSRAHLSYDQEVQGAHRGECEWNLAMQDIRDRFPSFVLAPYSAPSGPEGELLEPMARSILDGNGGLFLRTIKRW